MNAFQRVRDVSEKARLALNEWEKDCIDFSRSFLKTLQSDLGWPDGQFERITHDRAPENARLAPGGYTDAKGFHFAVRINATVVIVHVPFVVRKRADGGFDLDAGSDRTFNVNLQRPETIQPVTDHIADVMEEQVLLGRFAQVVGFKP